MTLLTTYFKRVGLLTLAVVAVLINAIVFTFFAAPSVMESARELMERGPQASNAVPVLIGKFIIISLFCSFQLLFTGYLLIKIMETSHLLILEGCCSKKINKYHVLAQQYDAIESDSIKCDMAEETTTIDDVTCPTTKAVITVKSKATRRGTMPTHLLLAAELERYVGYVDGKRVIDVNAMLIKGHQWMEKNTTAHKYHHRRTCLQAISLISEQSDMEKEFVDTLQRNGVFTKPIF